MNIFALLPDCLILELFAIWVVARHFLPHFESLRPADVRSMRELHGSHNSIKGIAIMADDDGSQGTTEERPPPGGLKRPRMDGETARF